MISPGCYSSKAQGGRIHWSWEENGYSIDGAGAQGLLQQSRSLLCYAWSYDALAEFACTKHTWTVYVQALCLKDEQRTRANGCNNTINQDDERERWEHANQQVNDKWHGDAIFRPSISVTRHPPFNVDELGSWHVHVMRNDAQAGSNQVFSSKKSKATTTHLTKTYVWTRTWSPATLSMSSFDFLHTYQAERSFFWHCKAATAR